MLSDGINLHSNMERFKDALDDLIQAIDYIYIPIWRDLKLIPINDRPPEEAIYIPIWRDLKPNRIAWYSISYFIYIPIWRDLKTAAGQIAQQIGIIYIPIWRDLKWNCRHSFGPYLPFTFQYGEI